MLTTCRALFQPAFDKSKLHYMSRGEKYRFGLAKEKRMFQISRQEGWDAKDSALAEDLLGKPVSCRRRRSGVPERR